MPREAASLSDILADARVWRLRESTGLRPPSRVWSTGRPALDARLPGGGWPAASLVEVLLETEGLGEVQLFLPALAECQKGAGPPRPERRTRGDVHARDDAHAPGDVHARDAARAPGDAGARADWNARGTELADIPWLVWIAPPHEPYAPALAERGIELRRLLVVRPGCATEALWAAEQALGSGTCAVVFLWLQGTDDRWLRRLKLAAEAGGALGVLFRPERHRFESSPASVRLVLTRGEREPNLDLIKVQGGRPGPVESGDS